MKIQTLLAASVVFALSACAVGPRSSTSTQSGSELLNELTSSNPLTGTNPTLNLFNTDPGTATTTATTTGSDTAPATTTSTLPAPDTAAAACLASSSALNTGGAQAAWSCLSNQAQNGQISQATIMAMAASNLQMMTACSTSVRQEIIQQIQRSNTSNQTVVSQIFKTAKVKLAQCYYRIAGLNQRALPYAPYQAQVGSYNAGNIWNVLNGLY